MEAHRRARRPGLDGRRSLNAILDTSVFIRHLTGDPPAQAARATRRLAEADGLVLPDVVIAECAHVLRRVYGVERPRVAALLRQAVMLPGIVTVDRGLLERALFRYERMAVSFPDAYIGALAARSGIRRVLSFDRNFDGFPGVERTAP